jgi:RNA polymerase sigma-70 factor (ECF subfamily)
MVLRSFRWKRTTPLEEANYTASPQADHVLPSVMMLEPKYRTVVYLHYYEGYSTKEIGHILKVSQSAVTTRLARARQILKDYITEE